MCEYCEKGRPLTPIAGGEDVELSIAGGTINLLIEYVMFGEGGSVETEYDIDYCPMCGRKLNERTPS